MNPMTESEVHEFRQDANWVMRTRNEEVEKEFHLRDFPHFAWHPWRGELVFSKGGLPGVVAQIQVAGSLAARGKTWTWSWANPALPACLQQVALRARQFGEERGVPTLIQPRWAATEADAWQMAAVACKLSEGRGAFKCPGPDATTFLVFTALRAVSDRKRVFGARTCAHVVGGDRPVLLVSRELDGEVLAVCGGEDDSAEAMHALTLDQLLGLDPSLLALADLPDGWVALRDSQEHDWARSQAE